MELRIIHRKDGIYDIYDKVTGKWLFSRGAADNVFVELSKLPVFRITFVDELWRGEQSENRDS